MANKVWPVVATVKIGRPKFRKPEDFLEALAQRGISYDKTVKAIAEAMVPEFEERVINLALVKLSDLGLLAGTRREKFFDVFSQEGLSILPAEAGFYYRMECGQLGEKKFHVAMRAITIPKAGPVDLFLLGYMSAEWINGASADSTATLAPECCFLCGVLPR